MLELSNRDTFYFPNYIAVRKMSNRVNVVDSKIEFDCYLDISISEKEGVVQFSVSGIDLGKTDVGNVIGSHLYLIIRVKDTQKISVPARFISSPTAPNNYICKIYVEFYDDNLRLRCNPPYNWKNSIVKPMTIWTVIASVRQTLFFFLPS